jgi:hypothetical protein
MTHEGSSVSGEKGMCQIRAHILGLSVQTSALLHGSSQTSKHRTGKLDRTTIQERSLKIEAHCDICNTRGCTFVQGVTLVQTPVSTVSKTDECQASPSQRSSYMTMNPNCRKYTLPS